MLAGALLSSAVQSGESAAMDRIFRLFSWLDWVVIVVAIGGILAILRELQR
jgi:hypothetical protein